VQIFYLPNVYDDKEGVRVSIRTKKGCHVGVRFNSKQKGVPRGQKGVPREFLGHTQEEDRHQKGCAQEETRREKGRAQEETRRQKGHTWFH
jgi:hypothetical protein